MWRGPRPTCLPSFILIRPTVWPQCTNITDRQTDRQGTTDRQRTDSIGQTVLQTVAPKKHSGSRHFKKSQTRMWANAQRDGHPVEYRWRPLFNTAKFGSSPLLQCRSLTLPRRETRCPKLTNRSQPLVGRSSPYCKDMWGRYCCLISFFPIVDTCLNCKDIARQSCVMVPR